MGDKLLKIMVGAAAGIVIVAAVGAGSYFTWRHFAYKAAVDECTLGLSTESLKFMEELNSRLGEPGVVDCMNEKGFRIP